MKLVIKNDKLFAVSEDEQFIGEIINSIEGGCSANPPIEEPGIFARIFEGHGYVYHLGDNPSNPFFNRSWGEVFDNPELLPEGTRNVFVDQSYSSLVDFRAVPAVPV